MKRSEVFVSYGRSDDSKSYSIDEFTQPFWTWFKGALFHHLVCPLEQKWTQWFWHLPWYRMHMTDPETGKTEVRGAPLCLWMDLRCYELRNAKKINVTSRSITQEEYERH